MNNRSGLVQDAFIFRLICECILGVMCFICMKGLIILWRDNLMTQNAMEWLRIIISVVSVAFAVYMGLRGNRLADSHDREDRIRSETRMDEKLNDVLSTSRDTRDSVAELRKDILAHNDRLIKTEESLKSLGHRVDNVEKRLNGG